MQQARCIPLGKITKPHGIRGELKVLAYTQEPENFKRYTTFFLTADKGKTLTAFTRKKVRPHGNYLIMSLEGCSDRNMAELLTGHEIWINTDKLPALHDGEYYLYELEGKRAVTPNDEFIGDIESVLIATGQDLLRIVKEGKEYLVPLVDTFIVSRDADQVVLDLPPGLLEIND